MKIEKKMSAEEEQLKELMGLIFDLYCECDHTNWEKPLFKNEKVGGEITGKIAWLEKRLWDTLVDLEDSFGLVVKEVEIDIKSLVVENKKEKEQKNMETTDTRKEIKELIEVLEHAIKKRQGTKYSLQAEVCIDCKKVISLDYEPVDLRYLTHRNHLTIVSDVDRNEIGDWLSALKWVLKLESSWNDRLNH